MGRKALIRTSEFPYHVSNRSNNREFFCIPTEELWPICIENLHEVQVRYKIEVHAFVLMNNHYHLNTSTPNENLDDAMRYFNTEVARAGNKRAQRINHFFAGRYRWSLIGDENYYWTATKYIFRNPVRAGLCKNVEDYKFSSLNQPASQSVWKLTDFFYKREKSITLDLDWLNEPFLKEHEEAIRKGLRRKNFELPKDKNKRLIELACSSTFRNALRSEK